MNDYAEREFRNRFNDLEAEAYAEIQRARQESYRNGMIPECDVPHVVIDAITLGCGKQFPIRGRYGIGVKAASPSLCPKANPNLPQEFLTDVERRFKEMGLVGQDESLHWVGDQADISTLCMCFRPGGPGAIQPNCQPEQAKQPSVSVGFLKTATDDDAGITPPECTPSDDSKRKDDKTAVVETNETVKPHQNEEPKNYLFGWREILDAINRKNNTEEKTRIRRLNDSPQHPGPITSSGQGAQPKVEKSKLIAWWNGLEDLFDEVNGRQRDETASVADRYKHGHDAEIVPNIDGSVKKRRKAKE